MSDFNWDGIKASGYMKFDPATMNTVRPTFIDDDPTVSKNSFNTSCFDFEVIDRDVKENDDNRVKTLSVTSLRLMRALDEYRPLSGKSFDIKRHGKGMDTDFDLTLIDNPDGSSIEEPKK